VIITNINIIVIIVLEVMFNRHQVSAMDTKILLFIQGTAFKLKTK